MVLEALGWVWTRFGPREGWLSLALLLLVTAILIVAVQDVGWVAEDGVIIPATLLGLLMGAVLARRPIPSWMAWALIVAYGLLIVGLTLGELWPPSHLLFSDWPALRLYWLENGALFYERAAAWVTAVALGGRSNETIIFAILMGLAAWFLAAYLGWSAYRRRQPLLGLTLMGLLIAINGYYGNAPIAWAAMFVGAAVLATAVFHLANLEWGWEKERVDYSTQIRFDLIVYAAGIGLGLLALSFLLPSLKMSSAASLLLGNESVAALEERLDRAFGGIDVPREQGIAPGRAGGAGIMPRAFLLGNAPELSRIVMMTATAEMIVGPQGASPAGARHWRGLSYEVYTGRGWALADESERHYRALEPLPVAPAFAQMQIRQNVRWRYDNRVLRYSLGRPVVLDHPTRTFWRDQTDLVRVTAETKENAYEIISHYSAATAEELRSATAVGVHPAILRRYRQLPASTPRRVHDLAQEVAGDQPTPYDQALVLEQFLRQYPYSLDVPFPPAGVDVVDYFLFDLQEGYCDYYASAMVVMARSLGLPARLASGFLAQEPDEDGVQTIRQINSHAWAEVYFANYGWVEFEPTAGFASPREVMGLVFDESALPERAAATEVPQPLPEHEPAIRPVSWRWIAGAVLFAAAAGFFLWRLASRPRLDGVQRAYGNMQQQAAKLGHALDAGETPFEFNERFQERLAGYSGAERLAEEADLVRGPTQELTGLFVEHQYSAAAPDRSERARQLWGRMRRPMWLLRLGRMMGIVKEGVSKLLIHTIKAN